MLIIQKAHLSLSFEKNFQDAKIPKFNQFLDYVTFESSKNFSKKILSLFENSKSELSQYLRYFWGKKKLKKVFWKEAGR